MSGMGLSLHEELILNYRELERECEAEQCEEEAAPVNEVVAEMRTATDENTTKLARQMKIDWEEAWTILRARELEDGASICCSEECEGHSSAMDELVKAARRGTKKRHQRRGYASEEEEPKPKHYVPPPRVRDAERFWPFMRCKNVAKVFRHIGGSIPKSHHDLLEFIAKVGKVSVEVLKKSSPREIFGSYPGVMAVIAPSRYPRY